jgi:hypothetical protein
MGYTWLPPPSHRSTILSGTICSFISGTEGWKRRKESRFFRCSVEDLGCLSWIPDSGSSDPDFYPSRIPDLTGKNSTKRGGGNLAITAPKEEGEIFLSYLFCSHKHYKIVNRFFLNR